METRTAYIRRRAREAKTRKRWATAAIFAVAGAAVLLFLPLGAKPHRAVASHPAEMPAAAAAAAETVRLAAAVTQTATRRPIYPYSIIPGGVANRNELAQVIKTDKVVAAHYASFNVDQAREQIVAKPRAVHVSYRKGDKVYWTKKKLMLAKGETLLSDGRNEMRARCANRISDVAQLPVEPGEPTAEELDAAFEEAQDLEAGGFQYASFGLDDNLDMASPASHVPQVFVSGGGDGGVRSGTALMDRSFGQLASVAGTVPLAPTRSTSVLPSSPVAQPPATVPASPVPSDPAPAIPVPPATGGQPAGDGSGQSPPVTPPAVPDKPAAPGPGSPSPGADPDGPTTNPGVPPVQPPLPLPPEVQPPGGEVPPPTGEVPPPVGEVPEPGTLWLCAGAFAAMLLLRRKTGARRTD